jgi:hypothetical protein
MKPLLAGLLAAASLAIAAPAQAAPQSFYFNCTGTLPLQTIDVESYSWSATAPTASYQEGAGCGWLDPGVLKGTNQPNPLYDAGFGGNYKGEVRKLELTLYAPHAPITTKAIDLIVTADGEEVANLANLTPVVGPGPDDAISSFTYTVTGLDLPAGTEDKGFVLAVAGYSPDDTPGWLQGTKEVPSGVKFFAFADLTPEEQEEILAADEE